MRMTIRKIPPTLAKSKYFPRADCTPAPAEAGFKSLSLSSEDEDSREVSVA
jgi:hypothetical protein